MVKRLSNIFCVLTCTLLLCGCAESQGQVHTIETETVPTDYDVVAHCIDYGMSKEMTELLDLNSVSLLGRFLYYTDESNLDTQEGVHEYLVNVCRWIDKLWVSNDFVDSYLKVTERNKDSLEVTLYQSYDTFELSIPFQCDIDASSYPNEYRISRPKETVTQTTLRDGTKVNIHSDIESVDNGQWLYIAHEAGFLPSALQKTNNSNNDSDVLYKFFYCYYSERYESKDIQTLSTILSMSDVLTEMYDDWSLNVNLDSIDWNFGGYKFTLTGTTPDIILQLKSKNKHIVNMAYPTDHLGIYSIQHDMESGQNIVVIPKVSELNVKDMHIPRKISKWPKIVKDCMLHILYTSKLYHLDNKQDCIGFKTSINYYISDIDMSDGLYDCAVDDIGEDAMQLIVAVKYKNKEYVITIIPEEVYYRMEELT